MDAWRKIAEERIRQAAEKGELEDLPGQGKPLELEDTSGLPEDVRLAYKILKNAGYTPAELEAKREIATIEEMLAGNPDEKTRYKAIKRLNFLAAKLGEANPRSSLLEDHAYTNKLVDVLIRPEKDSKAKQ